MFQRKDFETYFPLFLFFSFENWHSRMNLPSAQHACFLQHTQPPTNKVKQQHLSGVWCLQTHPTTETANISYLLCKFPLPGSEVLCFYVITQQQRLFKVSTVCFVSLFLLGWALTPLRCVSEHSSFISQPLTHSLHLSLFSLFTALCSIYPCFSCTKCLAVGTHTHAHTYTHTHSRSLLYNLNSEHCVLSPSCWQDCTQQSC